MRVELRAESIERVAWVSAASRAGYLSLSDWIRDVANKAAHRSVLASSADVRWNSPPRILIPIVQAFREIGLDPCSNAGSIVPARVAWTLERDGDSLARSWGGLGLVYVNPPFGREIPAWIAKIVGEAARGTEIVLCCPARVDTVWWQLARGTADAAILRGRVAFLDPETGDEGDPAPFPVAVLYYGERRDAFRRAFERQSAEFLERRLAPEDYAEAAE